MLDCSSALKKSSQPFIIPFLPALVLLAGLTAIPVRADAAASRPEQRHAAPHARGIGADTDFAYGDAESPDGFWRQRGTASYYGYGNLSRYTASGSVFDRGAMTAAHAWLPFGTKVNVRDEETGREVVVTITDRLPGTRRVIDLSVGAARQLGILRRGLTTVSLQHAT